MTKLPNRVAMDPDVLFRELDGEMVLLNLKDERYYGLDEVGSRTWQLLSEHGDVQQVIGQLLEEYDVDEERLRSDIAELIDELVSARLLSVEDA